MKEYRIVEETLEDNTKRYVVETRTKLFNKFALFDWEADVYEEDMGYYCITNIPAIFNELTDAQSYINKHYDRKRCKELRVIDRKIIVESIEI